ncbi:predicted protein [Histoplasma capsulatum G186AR]|uniref:Uncharacterized protein n=1 Tax=Ajellomyces capsulatus (strain G186AR / H82 / ATCC MYA-2454 / RMSCC 2432) TaxID=447093 RepID=C0NJN8_AJECG|nr:uncharacterized protein HCBG_03368 [Histoplasma capsulatum G186AR]EEH08079.1 predicted protein [Histoplasma capsulatum G186AR]
MGLEVIWRQTSSSARIGVAIREWKGRSEQLKREAKSQQPPVSMDQRTWGKWIQDKRKRAKASRSRPLLTTEVLICVHSGIFYQIDEVMAASTAGDGQYLAADRYSN